MPDSTPKALAPGLLAWYADVEAKYLDLVGDYAGKERFFIEGDSLLLECFKDQKLDFNPGFQILHAIYLVEQYLQHLSKRGCVFDVVFFHDHELLCIPPGSANEPRHLLARKIIIEHLRKHASNLNVFRFQSLSDKLFNEYLENSAVYFAICSDGASYAAKKLKGVRLRSYEERDKNQTNTNDRDDFLRCQLRSIIYRIAQKGLDVALFNGLEWRDSKVFAFVLQRQSKRHGDATTIDAEIEYLQHCNTGTEKISFRNSFVEVIPTDAQEFHSIGYNDEREKVTATAEAILRSGGWNTPPTRLIVTIASLHTIAAVGEFKPLIPACLLHTLLLELIPLSKRRVSTVQFSADAEVLYSSFVNAFSSGCLDAFKTLVKTAADDISLIDLFDGRLLRVVLQDVPGSLLVLPGIWGSSILPLLLSAIAGEEARLDTRTAMFQNLNSALVGGSGDELKSDMTILPFSHPVLDKHLESVSISVRDDQATRKCNVYQELFHWRDLHQHLPARRDPRTNAVRDSRMMRKKQILMANMAAYAASLTNAQGKGLRPELIVVDDNVDCHSASLSIQNGNTGKKSNKNSKPKSQQPNQQEGHAYSKGKIVPEIVRASEKAAKATERAWTTVRHQLDKETNLVTRFALTSTYIRDVWERKDTSAIANELELYRLSILVKIWEGYCLGNRKNQGKHVAALIYDSLLRLSALKLDSREMAKAVEGVACQCCMTIPVLATLPSVGSRQISFSFPSVQGTSLGIDENALNFRLMHTGPYMERVMDQKEDSRVSFTPDGWQRKVLDELDARNSLLVVAPTSAGKTFISFYAMEKVLRSNDDDLVVYVAPTKALVNQIAAEVQARFKKNYKHPGKSLQAIHTRDFKLNNPVQCQVLVTVPHILQIMLMKPANKSWVPRVKTIIFDEVHSITNADEGIVWEQLLMMAPCQIIALSATVGNSQAFAGWLSSTQSAVGKTLNFIEHEHRFSDLRKYMYRPPADFKFSVLPKVPVLAPLGLEDVVGMQFLHPISCLSHPSRKVPNDLALESRDCLLLWQAMKDSEDSRFRVPADLDPQSFFTVKNITKLDAISWGTRLKAHLAKWMEEPESPFRRVLAELSKGLLEEDFDLPNPGEAKSKAELGVEGVLQSTLPLLCSLRASDALPAILFNYNRSACERIVQYLLGQLSSAEKEYKSTNPAWKAKVKKYDAWKMRSVEAERVQAKARQAKGKGRRKEDTAEAEPYRNGGGPEDSAFVYFDPEAPLDDFSFADLKKSEREELSAAISTFKWAQVDDAIINAFTRGIGVHHSGMHRHYRQAVEVFFRRGFLTVVVATGTLSMGINMPCKTVVFSGDSVYLTALNFRQASGRAGRRGFDLLGNVVFQNIEVSKAHRLLSSRLPDIRGHFPLTTNFVLRILALLHGTDNVKYAAQMVNSLLSQPRLYLGGESFKHQVIHHVRFSIEYLRSQGLVNAEGEPINFASCVSRLYFAGNGDFAFHALLKGEFFHKLADELAGNEKTTLRTLMLVMAHVFGRTPMRLVDSENELDLIKRSASVVFLPPMPAEVATILKEHNEQTLATYEKYVRTFVEQHCTEPDVKLPLTGVCVQPTVACESDVSLPGACAPVKIRSPFVALSGQSDHFDSLSDLCDSVRDGVFLEKAVIPHLPVGDELAAPLNAYLYDFFQHGMAQALVDANRIGRGEVWFVLKDFSLVLSAIVTSFESLLNQNADRSEDVNEVDFESDLGLEDDDDDDGSVGEQDWATTSGRTKPKTAKEAKAAGVNRPVSQKHQAAADTKPVKGTKKEDQVAENWFDDDDSVSASSSAPYEDEDEDGDGDETAASEANANSLPATRRLQQQQQGRRAERRLRSVLRMFQLLREEFDTKFRKMWA